MMLFRKSKDRRRILIVEDDWAVLEVLKLMLEDDGHAVVTAEHGREAIDVIATSGGKPFDLIVMDISMPQMSGIELAQRLRADPKTKDMAIAIHTGLDEHWVRERFTDYDLFLTKAADTDLLIEEIRKLFAHPPGPREERVADDGAQRFAMEEAIKAQQALRDAMALGPALLSLDELLELLDEEIDQLRRVGEDDSKIARRIADAIGKPIPPAALARS
jgi:CheY-like chemotaxis protein